MSFKRIFFIFIACAHFSGCGVKARPNVPQEKAISSYVESYTDTPFEEPQKKPKKK